MSKHKPNKKLIERIKQKYGSIQRCIRETGLDERMVRLNLYRDSPQAKQAQALIEETINKAPKPKSYYLTDADRKDIRMAIMDQYYNVARFTKEHPEFTEPYMSYLLGGDIKCRKGKAKKVLEILGLN